MHFVVFDIDGTLVDSGSFETELYVRAIKTCFGDGPWDKKASQAMIYDFVAIWDRVEHSVNFPDLSAHEAIYEALGI